MNSEAWASIYFTMEKGRKGEPLSPPHYLFTFDPSQLRTEADQAAILAACDELVASAASNLTVVTSENILQLAQ